MDTISCATCGSDVPRSEVLFGDEGKVCQACFDADTVAGAFLTTYRTMGRGALIMSLIALAMGVVSLLPNALYVLTLLVVISGVGALRYEKKLDPEDRQLLREHPGPKKMAVAGLGIVSLALIIQLFGGVVPLRDVLTSKASMYEKAGKVAASFSPGSHPTRFVRALGPLDLGLEADVKVVFRGGGQDAKPLERTAKFNSSDDLLACLSPEHQASSDAKCPAPEDLASHLSYKRVAHPIVDSCADKCCKVPLAEEARLELEEPLLVLREICFASENGPSPITGLRFQALADKPAQPAQDEKDVAAAKGVLGSDKLRVKDLVLGDKLFQMDEKALKKVRPPDELTIR